MIEKGLWCTCIVILFFQGRMLVLDLFSEVSPEYTRLQSYYGQPFVWCMLHNFGGTDAMYGVIESVNSVRIWVLFYFNVMAVVVYCVSSIQGPFDGRSFPNSTMVGTGLTPEGINQNDMIYEFMNENAWRKQPRDIDAWWVLFPFHRHFTITIEYTYTCTLYQNSLVMKTNIIIF